MTTTINQEIPALDYLAWVARQARIDGELRVGKGYPLGEQTWARAIGAYEVTPAWKGAPDDTDWDEAEQTLAYFRAIPADEALGDYLLDLIVLFRDDDTIHRSRLALAASGLLVYRRAQEREAREQATQRQRQASEWVGRVGEPIRFTATVQSLYRRGGASIYTFRDTEGCAYTWFAPRDDLKLSWVYLLVGRVTKHDEYKGERKTVVTIDAFRVVAEGSHPGPKVGEAR